MVNAIDNELRWLNVTTPWLRGAMVELHKGHRRNFFLVVLCKNLRSELLHVAMLVFVVYLKRLFMTSKGFCSPQEVYGIRLVFSSRGVFMCLICALFLPFMERFLTTCLCWCLTLRRVSEYNCTTRAFQPMTLAILLKDIVVALISCTPFFLTLSLHLFLTVDMNKILS